LAITETEWVALITVIGTVGSGALSSLVTFKLTKRSIGAAHCEGDAQRKHDSDERLLDRQNARDLADRNWDQKRRQDAYVAIQMVVQSMNQYALRHQFGIGRPDQDVADFQLVPAADEALAQLIVSTAVEVGMSRLNLELINLQAAIQDARFWRGEAENGKPGAKDDFHRSNVEVREIAVRATSAAENVNQLMRDELETQFR
jgi:hypothetical protein